MVYTHRKKQCHIDCHLIQNWFLLLNNFNTRIIVFLCLQNVHQDTDKGFNQFFYCLSLACFKVTCCVVMELHQTFERVIFNLTLVPCLNFSPTMYWMANSINICLVNLRFQRYTIYSAFVISQKLFESLSFVCPFVNLSTIDSVKLSNDFGLNRFPLNITIGGILVSSAFF